MPVGNPRARASSSSPPTRRSPRGSASALPSAARSASPPSAPTRLTAAARSWSRSRTAHRVPRTDGSPRSPDVSNDHMAELFEAAVDATAESVCNALTAGATTSGRSGNTAYALPLDRLVGVLRRAGARRGCPGRSPRLAAPRRGVYDDSWPGLALRGLRAGRGCLTARAQQQGLVAVAPIARAADGTSRPCRLTLRDPVWGQQPARDGTQLTGVR